MKYVAVVGASSGIGKAFCERIGRTPGWLAYRFSRSTGHDFQQWGYAQAAVDECTVGRLEALVITAGHQATLGRIEDCSPLMWHNAVDANLGVAFNAVRALYPLLKKGNGRPKVIALGGGGASQGRPYFSAYAAAKTAVVRLIETLALEQPDWDCNCVAPGALNTRMLDAVLAAPELVGRVEHAKALEQRARGGDSMEKALDCIEWLISPESDGISGRFIAAQWDNYRHTGWRESEWGRLRRTTP